MKTANIIDKGDYPREKIYTNCKPLPQSEWPDRGYVGQFNGVELAEEPLDWVSHPCCGGKGRRWEPVNFRRKRLVKCECGGKDGEKEN